MGQVVTLADLKPEVIRLPGGRVEVRLPDSLRDRDLTTGDASALLHVSVNTVKNWIRAGYIREHKETPSGRKLVPAREVERVLAQEIRLAGAPDVGELSEAELRELTP